LAPGSRAGRAQDGSREPLRRTSPHRAYASRVARRAAELFTDAAALLGSRRLARARRAVRRGVGAVRAVALDWFTDAEAVVEWIDSGVIRISGRSLLHQKLRAGRGESRRGTAALLRRPPGPC
jgi:hypothetical protein